MTRQPFPIPALVIATVSAAMLAGCVTSPVGVPGTPGDARTTPAPSSLKVAVLLPITGPNAALGHDLQQAVQLALGPDGPQPDIRDTAGTPAGATVAAQAAVAAGDVMIIGPLTQGETAAAAAAANGTPILAFTSDRQQGRPGVWPLGITPQQQAARLVPALTAAGKTRIAALLPSNIFGDALADGLNAAAAVAADPPPTIKRYPNGRIPALDAALRDVSDYASRHGPADVPDTNAPASVDPLVDAPAPVPPPPLAPPPFDALMLAESGPALRTIAARLAAYEVRPPDVQVIGPGTWARDSANLGGLSGAWYAAPDPAARAGFEQAYTARYGTAPPGLADIAYDAAELARLAAGNTAVLTRPSGFAGVDGPLALRPNGQVLRGLAVFAVGASGARTIAPAPGSVGSGS